MIKKFFFFNIVDLFKGFFKGKKIQSLGFKTVYNLANYIQADELSSHKVNTAKALKSMTKNNFFFGKNSDCEKTKRLIKNENSLFLGSLILRLSKVAQLNSHQVSILNILDFQCQRSMNNLIFSDVE